MLTLLLALAVGQWTVDQKTDPMTDKADVTARLKGDAGSISFNCQYGQKPILAFESDGFLGGGIGRYELRDFVYRFDDGLPQLESWKYVRDYAVPYDQKRAVAFAMQMMKAKKLVIRAERYDRATIDATFDLTGSPQAFNEAFTKCGITP